jgi:hypothetical protein
MNGQQPESRTLDPDDEGVVQELAERIIEATPQPPPRKPGDSWFARAVSDSAAAAVGWWWELAGTVWSPISNLWKQYWVPGKGEFVDRLITKFTAGLEENSDLNPRLVQVLRDTRKWPTPFDLYAFWAVAVSIVWSNLWTWIKGIQNLKAQEVNAELRPNLLDQTSLLRYLIKNPQEADTVLDIMRRWGIPEEQIRMFVAGSESEPSLTELLVLVNRGKYTEREAENSLKRQGFDGETAETLMELRQFYPGPSDLVSLAGREAFEPESIAKFNLDQDFDLLDMDVFKKAGVSEEIARWYWVAHWNNPSLNQVFEMIHRQVEIEPGKTWSTDDLDTYYKLADINPFFGDMLRQIAYRVPTRVDTRRMFEMDVIDRAQVKKNYLGMGYDNTDADFLTEFAERIKDRFGRELSRSQVEKLYTLGQISAADFDHYLQLLDYSESEASQIRFLKDVDLEEERLKAFIDRVEYQYKRGLISREHASDELSLGDFVSVRVSQLLQDWDNEIITQQNLPGTQDLLKWLAAGLDVVLFRDYMKLKKYTDSTIDLYVDFQGSRLPSKTDLIDFFDRDTIDEPEFRAGLEALGYLERDIDSFTSVVLQTKERRADFERRNPGTSIEFPTAGGRG